MAAYAPEQLFALAKQNYDEAEAIILEVAKAIKENLDPNFNEATAMSCFDLVLQSSMLNAATADGELEHNEIVFMTQITKYIDLLSILNADLKEQYPDWQDITWDIIPQLDSETQKTLSAASVAVVEKYADAFVNIFATVDKVITDVDFLQLLTDKVGMMFVALTGIDGDDIEAEITNTEGNMAFAAFHVLVVEKWKAITGE